MADYISREALIEMVNGSERPENERIDVGYNEALNDIKQRLVEMPAADVEPIRRGRWSECYTDTHHYSGICSVCGKASIKTLTENLYNYCPKCGARMDGEQQ